MTGMSQVIEVIGAMVIFSLIMLNMNRFMMLNDLALVENEYEQVAMSVGQSIINEGRVQNFDDNSNISSLGDLTTYDNLGPELGEKRRDKLTDPYDDFDDYNGYTLTRSVNQVDYNLNVDVCYVEDTDLNTCVSNETFHKLMTVTVNNQYMDNPVSLRMVKSFY